MDSATAGVGAAPQLAARPADSSRSTTVTRHDPPSRCATVTTQPPSAGSSTVVTASASVSVTEQQVSPGRAASCGAAPTPAIALTAPSVLPVLSTGPRP